MGRESGAMCDVGIFSIAVGRDFLSKHLENKPSPDVAQSVTRPERPADRAVLSQTGHGPVVIRGRGESAPAAGQ